MILEAQWTDRFRVVVIKYRLVNNEDSAALAVTHLDRFDGVSAMRIDPTFAYMQSDNWDHLIVGRYLLLDDNVCCEYPDIPSAELLRVNSATDGEIRIQLPAHVGRPPPELLKVATSVTLRIGFLPVPLDPIPASPFAYHDRVLYCINDYLSASSQQQFVETQLEGLVVPYH